MSQAPAKYRVTQNGEPVSFGKVYWYSAQTSNPADTYQNQGLTVANTNPVILDANGEADIYLQPIIYREEVYTQNGALVRCRDSVSGDSLTLDQADARYVRAGSSPYISVVTRDVISNVRTYTGSNTGISSYASGLALGIVPDAVSGSETAFYINLNGLGDRRIYSSIGGLPNLEAGKQTTIVFNGTNFIVSTSAVLLSGQSSLDIVTIGTTEQTKMTAEVVTGTATLKATYGGGDANLKLQAPAIDLDSSADEYVTINGQPAATRAWATTQFGGKQAGIQFSDSGALLGSQGTVTAINFAGNLKATRSANALQVSVDTETPIALVNPVLRVSTKAGMSTQTISTTASAVIMSVDIDNTGMFVPAVSRVIPGVAGYYSVTWSAQVAESVVLLTFLTRNGTKYSAGSFHGFGSPATYPISVGSDLVYMNGTTDYLELWAQIAVGTSGTLTTVGYVNMSVCLASAA